MHAQVPRNVVRSRVFLSSPGPLCYTVLPFPLPLASLFLNIQLHSLSHHEALPTSSKTTINSNHYAPTRSSRNGICAVALLPDAPGA